MGHVLKWTGKFFQNCQSKKQTPRTKQTRNLETLIIKQTLIPSDYFLFYHLCMIIKPTCVYYSVISKLNKIITQSRRDHTWYKKNVLISSKGGVTSRNYKFYNKWTILLLSLKTNILFLFLLPVKLWIDCFLLPTVLVSFSSK